MKLVHLAVNDRVFLPTKIASAAGAVGTGSGGNASWGEVFRSQGQSFEINAARRRYRACAEQGCTKTEEASVAVVTQPGRHETQAHEADQNAQGNNPGTGARRHSCTLS